MGVESPSPGSLQSINKIQNVSRDLVADLRQIAANGIGVAAYLIVGLDQDDETIFERHIELWREARIIVPIVNILTAVPHTKLWLRLARQGRIVTTPGQRNGIVDLTSNIMPKGMSRRTLIEGYRYLLAQSADWGFLPSGLSTGLHILSAIPGWPARSYPTRRLPKSGRLLKAATRRAFDTLTEAARARNPELLRRVLNYVGMHDGRARFLHSMGADQGQSNTDSDWMKESLQQSQIV